MTRDEILALCNKARDVGSVKHADFVDYVVVLEGRCKVKGEWQTTEHAYMAVDGTLRVAMANLDHRQQNKRLDFGEPKVLVDNAEQLTLQVMVTSEIYGVRHGIATSRKKNGTNAEKDWPWEVVETSAIGRALAAMRVRVWLAARVWTRECRRHAARGCHALESPGGCQPQRERQSRLCLAPCCHGATRERMGASIERWRILLRSGQRIGAGACRAE